MTPETDNKITVYCNLTDTLMRDGFNKQVDDKLVTALKILQENKVDVIIMSNHTISTVEGMLAIADFKPKYIIEGGIEGVEELEQDLGDEINLTKSIFIDDELFWVRSAEEKGMQGVHCSNFKDSATIACLQQALTNVGYKGQPVFTA